MKIKLSKNFEGFLDIYKKTFKRQSIDLEDKQIIEIKNILFNMDSSGQGTLYAAVNNNNEEIAYNFILNYKDTSTYLFGATDPDKRSTGVGSALLANSIKQSYLDGQKKFDFCGINSPNRGDFKISFGGKPLLYFLVKFKG